MNDKKAMKLALEALEKTQVEGYNLPGTAIREAITALRESLAQPVQEPVAWLKEDWTGGHLNYDSVYEGAFAAFPVYKHPPAAQRPWVGLTDEEIASTATSVNIEFDDDFSLSDQTIYYVDAASLIGFTRAIEAKLKERNHG